MTAPEVELRAAWRQLAGTQHEHLLDALLAAHRQPHRRYHNATHVMWVLRHIAALVAAGEPVTDVAAVQLAAMYHDVVYDPQATDNESRSAALAAAAAADLGWPAARATAVAQLVRATAAHVADGPDDALLIDADLAILGASPAEYTAYVHGVRTEYAHVPDAAWRTGRAQVLHRFLDRPRLFLTDTMQHERGARARANLAAELATLSAA